MKYKHYEGKPTRSIAYRIGQALGTVVLGCVAALVATACIVPTIKLVMWLFSFI